MNIDVEKVDPAGDAGHLLELKAAEDPRTVAQMKAEDEDWTEGEIVGVSAYEDGTHWTVEWIEKVSPTGPVLEGKMGIGVPRIEGKPEPKVGGTIRTYGGLGYPVYGIDIDGEEVYWDTPWERFAKRVDMLARFDRERREAFEVEKDQLDAKYEALPAPLKARIDRFRRENAAFRVDGEAYEMAAVGDAPKIATALARQHGWTLDDNLKADVPVEVIDEAVKVFWKLDNDVQNALVPDLEQGHSGNTFGGAVSLAAGLLRGQDL